MTAGVVAELERQPTLEGLAVGDLRLGLDPSPPRRRLGADDLSIPRAQVTFDRQRHFRSPAQRWVEASAKAFKERELRPIPYRIPSRVRADREIQPDNSTIGSEKIDARIGHLAAFESTDSGVGRSDRAPDFRLAQTRRDPRESCVIGDPAHCTPGSPSSSIGRAVPDWHPSRSCQLALHSGSTANRTPTVPTDARGHRRARPSARQPLVRTPSGRDGGGGGQIEVERLLRTLVGTPSVRRAWAGRQAGQAGRRGRAGAR